MKAGFSLTKRFVPKWRDNDKADAADQLVAVFSMPTISDIFTILDALFNRPGAKDSTKLQLGQANKIVKQAGNFLPQYVKLENAEDFTIEDVVKFRLTSRSPTSCCSPLSSMRSLRRLTQKTRTGCPLRRSAQRAPLRREARPHHNGAAGFI
jgi:hypothetical protein